jgi:hypothetical protein
MGGVRWVKGSPSALVNVADVLLKKLNQALQQAMDEVTGEGANQMATFIATRGVNGKSGRILTGNMIGAVDARTQVNGTVVVGEFGWLNDKELYFLVQEKGRTVSGFIAPMLALQDAGIAAREELLRVLSSKLGSL